VAIDYKEVRELLMAVSQMEIAELILKSDDFELTVRKGTASIQDAPVVVSTPTVTSPQPMSSPPAEPEPPSPPPSEQKWVEVTSPMVGTFYRSPAPGEDAFVKTSDQIRTGQTVCIIEAMKLMNEIEAEVSGQVMEILVEDGEPVEYGQVLMRVDPG
jgi:acetyl-CoA carboxylase biotin carboxyl carrier protein